MKPNQLYLRCSCYSEVLVLDYWDDEDGELCVAIYSFDYRRSWWWRLKLAWHILNGGDNHTDQIVLSKEDTQKVMEWLNLNDRLNQISESKTI